MSKLPRTGHMECGTNVGSENASEAGKSLTEKAKEGISDVVDQTKQKIASVAEKTSDAAKEYGSKAWDVSSDITENVVEAASSAGQRAAKELTEFVQRNPIPALLAAFGIGYLIASAGRR